MTIQLYPNKDFIPCWKMTDVFDRTPAQPSSWTREFDAVAKFEIRGRPRCKGPSWKRLFDFGRISAKNINKINHYPIFLTTGGRTK